MIRLALKYLLAKKKQTFFILLGIFLGTCGYIVMSGFLLGWKNYFTQEMIHNDAHLFIRTSQKTLKEHDFDHLFYANNKVIRWVNFPYKNLNRSSIQNKEKWFQILKNDPKIKAFSFRYSTNASLSFNNRQIASILIGCYPQQEKAIKNITSNIIEGKFEDIAIGNNRLAIGYALSNHLGIKLNQTIMVSIEEQSFIPFKICAIFKTNNIITDWQVYGFLPNIQDAAGNTNNINEIAVKLHDHTLARNIASGLSFLGDEKIESWDQIYLQIFKMCFVNDIIRFAITGIIMLVAGFGIYNVLNMSIMQKRKDMVILRSIGYSNKNIFQLFLSQGLIVGIFGSFLGIAFGYLLSHLMQKVLPSDFYSISFDLSIYFNAALIGMIFALISSFFPARFAKKMSPIEIIRSGVE